MCFVLCEASGFSLTLWVNTRELQACIVQDVQGQGHVMKLEVKEKQKTKVTRHTFITRKKLYNSCTRLYCMSKPLVFTDISPFYNTL